MRTNDEYYIDKETNPYLMFFVFMSPAILWGIVLIIIYFLI